MPLTYVRPFRLRYYECNAAGLVYPANYLRYMQETAFDASASAGYDVGRYETMDRIWLVRETDLEIVSPLRYPCTIEVKTWVADFRRVRSIRAYEFRLAGSEGLAARAFTDWAFLDRTTGRPTAIPKEMMSAFFPEGVPPNRPPRPHAPPVVQPPDRAECIRRLVNWTDLDQAGHVNNANYSAFVEDSQMRAAATFGGNAPPLCADGLTAQMRRLHISYLRPATMGDELEIITWAGNLEDALGVWFSVIRRVSDGAAVAQVRAEWACAEPRSVLDATAYTPVT